MIPAATAATSSRRRPADAAPLWRAWSRRRDGLTRERLIRHYTYLAKHVVDRLGLRPAGWLGQEDLLSHAVMGLIDAIEKFDPARGVRFETYAVTRIRGAVLDMLRALDWIPRETRRRENELKAALTAIEAETGRPATDHQAAERLGWDMDDYYATLTSATRGGILSLDVYVAECGDEDLDPLESLGYTSEDPARHAEKQERRRLLVDAIESLNQQERTVLSLYYFEDMTLKEIGATLSVSESRVCQVHTKAIWRLQGKLARHQEALHV